MFQDWFSAKNLQGLSQKKKIININLISLNIFKLNKIYPVILIIQLKNQNNTNGNYGDSNAKNYLFWGYRQIIKINTCRLTYFRSHLGMNGLKNEAAIISQFSENLSFFCVIIGKFYKGVITLENCSKACEVQP